MADRESIRYDVSVKHLAERPTVGADGNFTRAVSFHVELREEGEAFDLDGGTVSGQTLCRCEMLREKGCVTVELPTAWLGRRSAAWQQEIVNRALDLSMSESA